MLEQNQTPHNVEVSNGSHRAIALFYSIAEKVTHDQGKTTFHNCTLTAEFLNRLLTTNWDN